MKTKLAIFMHGGISGGYCSQGFPGIVRLTEKLSERFNTTVFSLAFSEIKHGTNFRIVSPPWWLKTTILRFTWLAISFLVEHRRTRFDHLFSFWGYPMGMFTVWLAKRINRPSSIYLLGAETANIPQLNYGYLHTPRLRRRILWTCNNATRVIALTRNQVAALKDQGLGRTPDVIPFGVDKELFFPRPKRRELPLKIVHVANITAVKDQRTLILTFQEVLKKIPATLRVVGPDYLNGEIQKLAAELRLMNSIRFCGPVLHKEISSHYHWADLCILTSLSEGQNTALTEAMMCGILPASTCVGIMDDEFGNKVGIVAEVGDYSSLAQQIIDLYNNEKNWDERVAAAQQWASEFDLEWTTEQLTTLIEHGK